MLSSQHMCARVIQVLKGAKAPKEVRRARAHALRELGGMFLDAAATQKEVVPPAQGENPQVTHPQPQKPKENPLRLQPPVGRVLASMPCC